ncbi:4-hydroxybenzoate 3-monooxygenase [Micromonospora sp. NBC_01813]|uniref:4-hydroxybenzoate 3-monooxygenase n=1 Tax=Micromonospora sp. NBC_01813 TaxID=2975988 RepID=UPI002DDBDA80|nr:4-hydroxybenzoate 3-monooxygenase [Micromonospora sp. NBC_01813]WSA11716.1 4-hydroxybenzoate 3-monooxygenase [Micromonospora sp. NBC_01813]
MRTQVGIIGAGPAGLMLSHLLHLEGIDSIVLETRSRSYVESRVRAGVLEHDTAQLLTDTGVGDRLRREGLVHTGLDLRFDGVSRRIDLSALTSGRGITVYGQQEVVKDLIAARLAAGGEILFEVTDVSLDGIDSDAPMVRFKHEGTIRELSCVVVAGCDGFHGVSRPSIPSSARRTVEHTYPFSWLGILAQAAPSAHELIYTHHERGFALHSMRSPEVTRLYLQVPNDTLLADWPAARIWDELHTRLATNDGFTLKEGPILEQGVTPMRSFVTEPMRYGQLFLAGDAAHIVPPTGAKGLNLAMADVRFLADALSTWFRQGRDTGLGEYSARCLRRVWRVQHFSAWMTNLLHQPVDADEFSHRLQVAHLEYVATSTAAATTLAENYVGLPLDWSSRVDMPARPPVPFA